MTRWPKESNLSATCDSMNPAQPLQKVLNTAMYSYVKYYFSIDEVRLRGRRGGKGILALL